MGASCARRTPSGSPCRARFACSAPALAAARRRRASPPRALSPPGRALVGEVREAIGVERGARRRSSACPPTGRACSSTSEAGPWVVRRRRLEAAARAAGARRPGRPYGRFVVAVAADELAALEPDGDVRWKLARPAVRLPRWGGTRRGHAHRLPQRPRAARRGRRRQRRPPCSRRAVRPSRRPGVRGGRHVARLRRRRRTCRGRRGGHGPAALGAPRPAPCGGSSGRATAACCSSSGRRSLAAPRTRRTGPLRPARPPSRAGDRRRDRARRPLGRVRPARRRPQRALGDPAPAARRERGPPRVLGGGPLQRPRVVAGRPLAPGRLARGRPVGVHPLGPASGKLEAVSAIRRSSTRPASRASAGWCCA